MGIAGGPEKCAWLKDEAGFDDVIDYKNEDVNARIAETCPNKLDVYFDNVGGDILEAALNHLNLRARIVMCGGISGYNATQPIPGPANLMNIVTTRSRMEGFIILDYMARAPEAINELLGWIGSGELKFQVDVQEGFDNIPDTSWHAVYWQESWQAIVERSRIRSNKSPVISNSQGIGSYVDS